jgi:predicted N-acetyltransferase YhbS
VCKDVSLSDLAMISPSDTEPKLDIRQMQSHDAHSVSALIAQLGYRRTPEQVLEWIESTRASSQQVAFVACWNGEVVGWIEISIERRLQSPAFALIGGLVVKDGFRGQGIGRELCRCAEEWSWERSVHTVRVTSRSTRPDAHRFYVRDGYRVVKTSMVFEKDRSQSA